MTEQKADYITDAAEMLGKGYEEPAIEIEQPRTVTERRNGKLVEADRAAFVKIYTNFKDEMRAIDADALKVWLFIALSVNRFSGEAHPGLRAISAGAGMAVNTVRDAVNRLENKYGLLQVEKEDGMSNKYYPADYVSANRGTVLPGDTPPTVSKSKGTVSKNQGTVSKNGGTVSTPYRKSAQPENQNQPDQPNAGGLSEIEIQQANAQVDAIIEASLSRVQRYPHREKMPEPLLPYCDIYVELTGQTLSKRVILDWMQTFEDWKAENLSTEDIRAAYKHATRPDGGFLVGRPGSLTNTAVALKSKGRNAPDRKMSELEKALRVIGATNG